MSYLENERAILINLQKFFIELRELCKADKVDQFEVGGLLDELSDRDPDAHLLLLRTDSAINTVPHREENNVDLEERTRRFADMGYEACVCMLKVECIREKMSETPSQRLKRELRESSNVFCFSNRHIQAEAAAFQVNYSNRKDITPALMKELRELMNKPIMPLSGEEFYNWAGTPMREDINAPRMINMKPQNMMIGVDMETTTPTKPHPDDFKGVPINPIECTPEPPQNLSDLLNCDWKSLELETLRQAEEYNSKKASEETKEVEDDMDWDEYTGRPKNPNPMAMWEDMHRELDEYDS